MRVKIELTPNEVCQAIKDWVRKEYGKEPNDVSIHLSQVSRGYGVGEHTEHEFTGATVTI